MAGRGAQTCEWGDAAPASARARAPVSFRSAAQSRHTPRPRPVAGGRETAGRERERERATLGEGPQPWPAATFFSHPLSLLPTPQAQLAAAAPTVAAAADVLSTMSSVQLVSVFEGGWVGGTQQGVTPLSLQAATPAQTKPPCRARALSLAPPTPSTPPSPSPPLSTQAATAALVTLLALAAAHVLMGRPLPGVPSKKSYLLDFFCYRPPARLRTSRAFVTEAMASKKLFSPENVEFQKAIMDRSGLGDETGLSDGIMAMKDGATRTTLADAIQETEMVMFDIVENVLAKTGIAAQKVGREERERGRGCVVFFFASDLSTHQKKKNTPTTPPPRSTSSSRPAPASPRRPPWPP